MNKKRPAPNVKQEMQVYEAAGFKVTETVVWKGGKSRSFSPGELKAGAAEAWLKERR